MSTWMWSAAAASEATAASERMSREEDARSAYSGSSHSSRLMRWMRVHVNVVGRGSKRSNNSSERAQEQGRGCQISIQRQQPQQQAHEA